MKSGQAKRDCAVQANAEGFDRGERCAGQLPGTYVPLVSRGVEFTPSANPHFRQNEMLYAYFEMFDPRLSGRGATKLRAHLKIVDAKTGDLRVDLAPVDAAPYIKANSTLVPMARGIDLSTLPEGEYELEVQAIDSAGIKTDWRKTTFFVDEFSPLEQLRISCSIEMSC
jgi:hypothetical protein